MKRAGRDVVEFYPALRRLAAGGGSEDRAKATARFGGALRNLQRGLTGDRLLAGASYFSSADYLGAYLLYYWPVSFVQVFLALQEIDLRGALPTINRVLDIGAGPGPATFAAARFGAKRSRLIDANGDALQAALRLGQEFGIELETMQKNLEADDSFEDMPAQASAYDLIVACHSANELWKGREEAIARRASLFGKAATLLAEGGILLVVEPSANVTGRPALELRDRLLAENPELDCVAPCPGSFPCPIAAAGEGRSCHSTWRWEPDVPVAALAEAAGLDRDSAKATWFALKKGVAPRPPARVESTLRDGAEGAGKATHTLGGLTGRFVSEAMLNKAGRVRYIVCTKSGLATLSAKAGDKATEAEGFFSLKRGDCIEAEGLERRAGEHSFGLVPGSRLTISLKAPEA